MTKLIEVKGLEELRRNFKAYPVEFAREMSIAMVSSLLTLQENVPPYPPKPSTSTYKRTGQLGRSLGVSESGGRIGTPDIFKVRRLGGGNFEGRFGTNLKYAPHVIGERGVQSSFFGAYWWQLDSVVGLAFNKIKSLYNIAARQLAAFLERQ